MKKITFSNKLIVGFAVAVVALISLNGVVYADCESTYGGGKECDRSFKIIKKVRKEGDNTWKDKVTGVDEDEIVEFKITVENTGDSDADDMKYEDKLPKELEKVGGAGLTEEWDDFSNDNDREFIIKAKVKDSEYDRDNFDKCVVNKVELTHDGDYEGSDTATVCYSDKEVTELPKTGAETNVLAVVSGLGLTFAGFLIKKSRR